MVGARGPTLVAWVALAACAPPGAGPDAGTDGGEPWVVTSAIPRTHSHNDELQRNPLDDALALRMSSIEVDVVLYEGDLLVGHDVFTLGGGLDVVYLDHLQDRVDQRGSVYGDGAPFTLWIDLKSDAEALRDAVFETLERYDMLTRFTSDTVDERAVTVVLTGDEGSKAAFIDEHPTRRACRDSNFLRVDDDGQADTGFRYYALAYSSVVPDGSDQDGVAAALAGVVDAAHGTGRPLRIWGAPDTVVSWRAQAAAGVDFVGADDLVGLAAELGE